MIHFAPIQGLRPYYNESDSTDRLADPPSLRGKNIPFYRTRPRDWALCGAPTERLVCAQRLHRIDLYCASCGQVAGEQIERGSDERDRAERYRVIGTHMEQ